MTLCDFATSKTREFTPGPGAYDVESYNGIGKTGLFYSVRPKYKDKVPLTSKVDYPKERPGLTPQDKTVGPIIGLREKEKKTNIENGPKFVPDPNEFFNHYVKIRNRLKDSDTFNGPGPGAYSPQELSKFQIPQMSPRGEIKLSDIGYSPGPSAYSIDRSLKGGHKYTIRPKTDPPADRTVGPGYKYNNPRTSGNDSPRWQFPRADKIEEKDPKIPGPGYYDQEPPKDSRLHTKIRSRMKERKPEYSNVPIANTRRFPEGKDIKIGKKFDSGYWSGDNQVPGPSWVPESSVNIQYKRGNLKIGEKFKERTDNASPGPCDYAPQDPKAIYMAFTMKGPLHRDEYMPKDLGVPGPGAYNIRYENNLPRWSIGDKSRGNQSARRNRSVESRGSQSARRDRSVESRGSQSARRMRDDESRGSQSSRRQAPISPRTSRSGKSPRSLASSRREKAQLVEDNDY